MPFRPLLLALLLLAAPAAAQDRPRLAPDRDVAVTYWVPQARGEMQMSFLAARHLARMDMPGAPGWIVANTREGGGFMVMPGQRLVMDMAAAEAPGPNFRMRETARFTREGRERLVDHDCTLWRVEDQDGVSRACITAEGVVLRAETEGHPSATIEARRVVFGPQDPTRFEPPAGYRRMAMPGMPGGAMGPGGGMPRGTALPPPGLVPPPGR